MQETTFYEVEQIKDRRYNNGRKEYLIKWKGYSDSESTWEPLSHLKFIHDLVIEFDIKYENKNIKKIKKGNYKENKNIQFIEKKREKSKKEHKNSIKNIVVFRIDHSLVKILAVKIENQILKAVVEKKTKEGRIYKEIMTTECLKKINPFILLDFYQSKIKCV